MLVTVIRPFPFSRDGRTQEHASASPEPQDIPDAIVPGLISEGYVCPEGHPPVAFSAGRRRIMVDRITELFRAHMEALSDDQLTEAFKSAERETARAAEVQGEEALLPLETKVEPPFEAGGAMKLDGLAAMGELKLDLPPELFDVLYRNPTSGEPLKDVGLTREAADARAAELAGMDEPAADIAVVPHVALAAMGEQGGVTAPADLFDADAADEAALRAYLTLRDGKEPDKRFGVDRLRSLAKADPATDDSAGE